MERESKRNHSCKQNMTSNETACAVCAAEKNALLQVFPMCKDLFFPPTPSLLLLEEESSVAEVQQEQSQVSVFKYKQIGWAWSLKLKLSSLESIEVLVWFGFFSLFLTLN